MKALSHSRFRALVEAYGGDLSRFPEAEREAARCLVEGSAEARALLEAEAGLDAHLAALAPPPMSPTLERRLFEVPLRAPRGRASWPFKTRWIPALSWAVAAAFGLWLGAVLPAEEVAGVGAVTAGEPVSGTPAEEDELLEIAYGAGVDAWGEP